MYIPAYLTVVLYRPLASADKDKSNPILMLGMYRYYVLQPYTYLCFSYRSSGSQHVCSIVAIQLFINSHFLSAVRYCGITFGYTSISILLNYSELDLDSCPHSETDR